MQGLIGGFASGDPSAIQSRRTSDPMAPLLALSPDIVLEPSALDTLVSGRLSSAYDLSGNGRAGVQATVGQRPLLAAGAGPGGTDAWSFTSARQDHIEIANDSGIEGAAWTFFVVVKKPLGNGCLLSKAVGSSAKPVDGYTYLDSLSLAGEVNGVTPTGRGWCVTGGRRDPGGSGTAEIFLNGAIDATAAVAPWIDTVGTPPIRIGARADFGVLLDGDIAHVCAWNRALTGPEIATVHAYFAARFGL